MSDPISPNPVAPPLYSTSIEPPTPNPRASTAPPGALLDAAIATMKPMASAVAAYAAMFGASPAKANVDAFYAAANPTLLLSDGNGTTKPVTIALPFRMSTNPPSPAEAKKLIDFELPPAVAKKLAPAIDMVVWGRGTPEQCAQVAQALLDVAGAPTTWLTADGVRRYLEQYGIGVDCAGYAQQAAMKAVGLDPTKAADRVKFGFAPFIGNESMAGVPTSPKFTKIAPEDAKPGDIVSLGAPSYENVGHSLVVASNKLVGPHLRAIEVDSSWGGKVGVARVTWLYDETTKKWATLEPGGTVVPSSDPNGPYGHPLKGFFRSKLAP